MCSLSVFKRVGPKLSDVGVRCDSSAGGLMTEEVDVGLASEVKPRSRCVSEEFGQ